MTLHDTRGAVSDAGEMVAGSVSRREALKVLGAAAAGGTLVANVPVSKAPPGIIGWHQTQKLVAHDGLAGDQFGYSVAIAEDVPGTRALVGAPNHFAFHSGRLTGAAYEFFQPDGGDWELRTEKVGVDTSHDDRYGESVDMYHSAFGDGEIVGMPRHRHTTAEMEDAPRTGAVDIFDRDVHDPERWGVAEVIPDDGGEGDGFGKSVAVAQGPRLGGPYALVGAPFHDDFAKNDGAAYFATARGGFSGVRWDDYQKVGLPVFDAVEDVYFGAAVALSGSNETALVGAPGIESEAGYGRVYLFELSRVYRDEWNRIGESFKSGRPESFQFGLAVALSFDGSVALVGAPLERPAGAAYVFTRVDRDKQVWTRERLLPRDGGQTDLFGSSVAINGAGTTALVGAPLHNPGDTPGAGAAYVFSRTRGGEWKLTGKLLAEDRSFHDELGWSVALSDEGTALVGAPKDDNASGPHAGAVYVFEYTGLLAIIRILLLLHDEVFRWLVTGEEISFDASASTATPDQSIIGFAWDFNGDNQFERQGKRVTYIFDEPGLQTVRLRVTDERGTTAMAQETLLIHQRMEVDIKPDDRNSTDPAPINPKSKGVTPVAIHATEAVDPATVDVRTLSFGPADGPRAHAVKHSLEDIDDDGRNELVVHFRTQEAGFAAGDESGVVVGETENETPLVGTDEVKIVGSRGRGHKNSNGRPRRKNS